MPRPKRKSQHKKSEDIGSNDGRRNNGGNSTVPKKTSRLTPAKLNKQKKERIRVHANQAIANVFGGEQEFWNFVAEKAKDGSTKHLDFLGKYALPDPSDLDHSGGKKTAVPVINFFGGNATPQLDNTIDITEEE